MGAHFEAIDDCVLSWRPRIPGTLKLDSILSLFKCVIIDVGSSLAWALGMPFKDPTQGYYPIMSRVCAWRFVLFSKTLRWQLCDSTLFVNWVTHRAAAKFKIAQKIHTEFQVCVARVFWFSSEQKFCKMAPTLIKPMYKPPLWGDESKMVSNTHQLWLRVANTYENTQIK